MANGVKQREHASKHNTLVLERPDPATFTTNAELLRLCYLLWDMSDGKFVPNPLEVINLPKGYVDDLFKWHTGVQFYVDYDKRPGELK